MVGADLVHQETELGCPALPELQLILGAVIVVLQPQLVALQDQLLDHSHPLLQTSLKPHIIFSKIIRYKRIIIMFTSPVHAGY